MCVCVEAVPKCDRVFKTENIGTESLARRLVPDKLYVQSFIHSHVFLRLACQILYVFVMLM